MNEDKDVARQILEGEKRLKALGEKELTVRNKIKELQEERKTLEARLGLMRIESDMARDGGMKNAIQDQIKQLVQKLKDSSDEIKKQNTELESVLNFRRQLQEAIAAQKRKNLDAAQLAEVEAKGQEYDDIIGGIEQLTEQYNQLREHILKRFDEIKMLNKRSSDLKLEIDRLRGVPDAKKSSGYISNFVTQTITLPFFDMDEKLLKLDPLSKY